VLAEGLRNRSHEIIFTEPATQFRDKSIVHSKGSDYITESIQLPLSTYVDDSVMKAGATLGAGAIEAVGGQLIVLDTFGHFFGYRNGVVEANFLPDLPMRVDDFAAHSGRPFNSASSKYYLKVKLA
jgi:hypothetical protein